MSESVRPSVRPSVSPSVSPAVRQSVSLSVRQSVRQSVSQSVSESVSPSVRTRPNETRHVRVLPHKLAHDRTTAETHVSERHHAFTLKIRNDNPWIWQHDGNFVRGAYGSAQEASETITDPSEKLFGSPRTVQGPSWDFSRSLRTAPEDPLGWSWEPPGSPQDPPGRSWGPPGRRFRAVVCSFWASWAQPEAQMLRNPKIP